ncbi:MAG: hypothetical protein ACXAEN_07330 [Candidatus Thorarchaeota archaeon]|jgi:hypothetical protein
MTGESCVGNMAQCKCAQIDVKDVAAADESWESVVRFWKHFEKSHRTKQRRNNKLRPGA